MESNNERRNRDFTKRALAILSDYLHRHEHISRHELIIKTLAQRPSCYYVDIDHASRILSKIMNTNKPKHAGVIMEMWYEMADKVKALMTGPRRLSRHKAVAFVLNFDRPSRFFMTYRRACEVLRARVGTRSNAYIIADRCNNA